MMIKKICKGCGKKYNTDKKNFYMYCSNLCKSRDKFIIIEGIGESSFKLWKANFNKYPEFYSKLNKKNKLNNKCFVCGFEYKAFRMCCSKKCSLDMKKQTTLSTTGAEHNLSKDSAARLNMEENLVKLYGVSNVYQREDVKNKLKDTWILKYGYDNPSKSKKIKDKKRKSAENNGFWTPRDKWPLRKIYEANVYEITWSQMRLFAKLKFGAEIWDNIKESRKLEKNDWLTVDHKFSRNEGFLNNINPDIIGHISNLDILTFSENRNKWASCSITLEELKEEIKFFDESIRNEN